MKFRTVTAFASALAFVGLLAAPLSASAVPFAPAAAVSAPAIKSAIWEPEGLLDLLGYRSTIAGTQLAAAGGPIERSAWSAANGRVAAQSASIYNTRMVYGLEKFAAVQPLHAIGPDVPLVKDAWYKFKKPTFGGGGLARSVIGGGALLGASMAWEMRGNIANGVLSFTGSKTGSEDLVCGNVDGTTAFTNWVTQADCSLWEQAGDFNLNAKVNAGYSSQNTCYHLPNPSVDYNWCTQITGFTTVSFSGNQYPAYCLAMTTTQPGDGSSRYQVAQDLELASGRTGYLGGSSWRATVGPTQGAPCGVSETAALAGPVGMFYWSGSGSPDPIVGLKYMDDVQGSYAPVTEASGDAIWSILCELTGTDGNVYSGRTGTFLGSDAFQPAPVCGTLPQGVDAAHWKYVAQSPGIPDVIFADQDALANDPQLDALLGASQAQYCQTNVCVLDLILKSSQLTCFSQAATCDGWMDDASKLDKYECQYGGHTVAISECNMYAHIFNTQKRLSGNPYADPLTGEDTNTQTGISLDQLTMGSSPRASFQGRDCFGGGYSDPNPLQWVLKPLQCAAEWAAVPRASVVEAAQIHNTDAYAGKIVKVLPETLASWSFVPPANGCSGIPVDVWFLGPPFNVMGACAGSMLAPMAFWARLFSALSITVMGVLALTRYAGKTFGYTGLGSGADS